tara:strand:+ start:1762 stop:2781 length:1020 start_codon:yes stop_codon:yes gene_type:complete
MRHRQWAKGAAALGDVTHGCQTTPQAVLDRISVRGDAGETLHGVEALSLITSKVYEAPFKPNQFLDFIAFDTTGGAGLRNTIYYEGESSAKWSRLGAHSADFDKADASAVPQTVLVECYVSGFDIWLRDLEAAQRSGSDIAGRYARAVRASYQALLQAHSLFGDPASQIEGLFNSGRIKNRKRLTTAFTTATVAADLYDGLVEMANSIPDTSEGLHDGFALVIPGPMKRHCDTSFRGTDSTVSVTDWFEGSTNYSLIGAEQLKSITGSLIGETGTTSGAVGGALGDPMVAEKKVPRPFFQMPQVTDMAGLRLVTPVIADIGGWHIYEPTALCVRTNIWS